MHFRYENENESMTKLKLGNEKVNMLCKISTFVYTEVKIKVKSVKVCQTMQQNSC